MYRGNFSSSSSGHSSKRARWQAKGANFKARAVQGDVTINLQVNDKEPNRRIDWQHENDDAQRVGNFVGNEELDIVRGDLLFIVNQESKVVRSRLGSDNRNAAFASFNAFPTMGARSIEEFQRFFKFVGIAKGPYMHQSIDQPLNGVAAQHRGATSVRNSGVDTFNVGDKGAAVVPSPNKQARESLAREAGRFAGVPPTRLHAVPARVSYAQAVQLPERAMAALFASNTSGNRAANDPSVSLRRLRARNRVDLAQLQSFALNIKRQALQSAWNALAVFQAYGLITLNTPSASSLAGSRSLDATLLKKGLHELLADVGTAPQVTVDPAAPAAARVNLGAVQSDAQRRRIAEQLKWVALKLDLVHEDNVPERDQIEPSQQLVDALVAVNFATFFNNDNNARVFDARRFIDRTVKLDDLGSTIVAGPLERYAKDTFGAQLSKSQHDAPRGFYGSAITAKLFVDSTIAFEALNYSRKGEPLDVCM